MEMDLARLLDKYTPRAKKPILGMSDNTLILAWAHKKGIPGFYAPVFNDLSRDPGERTAESLKKLLSGNTDWSLKPTDVCKDWIGGEKEWKKNEGEWIIQEGAAEGDYVVGHLSRLQHSQMMGWLPDLKDKILFTEQLTTDANRFYTELEVLLSLPGADRIKGLCIGRFAASPKMTKEMLQKIIASKEELKGKPVVANLDFGHTYPIETLPFAGKAKLVARKNEFVLEGRGL